MHSGTFHIRAAGSAVFGLRLCAALLAERAAAPLRISTDHGHAIRDAVAAGAFTGDILALPAAMIDWLASRGWVAGPAVPLGSVGIGAVTRAGCPLPDLRDVAALGEALRAADAVLLTRAPSGEHLLAAIARLGLSGEVSRKLHRFATATLLNDALAASRFARPIGFAPITEILCWRWGQAGSAADAPASPGIAFAGEVPAEIQDRVPYAAAMLAATPMPEAAQRVLAALEEKAAATAFRRTGMQ